MRVLAQLGVAAAAFGALFLGACFQDIPTAADVVCTPGQATCSCQAGDVCATGLSCEAGICRSLRCEAGVVGCECGAGGSCFDGAACIEGSCILDQPVEPASDADAESAAEASDADGDTAMGSETGSESGAQTTGVADTGEAPVSGECGCGWLPDVEFWECSLDPEPNPAGMFGRCPDFADTLYERFLNGEEGIPCDIPLPGAGMVSIDFAGCCVGNVASMFCDLGTGTLVFETCATSFYCGA
ncbi:MAG: hypothetical protein AAGA54_21150 [Myxococcota bacterium]